MHPHPLAIQLWNHMWDLLMVLFLFARAANLTRIFAKILLYLQNPVYLQYPRAFCPAVSAVAPNKLEMELVYCGWDQRAIVDIHSISVAVGVVSNCQFMNDNQLDSGVLTLLSLWGLFPLFHLNCLRVQPPGRSLWSFPRPQVFRRVPKTWCWLRRVQTSQSVGSHPPMFPRESLLLTAWRSPVWQWGTGMVYM